jgi:hypothetical protein
VAFFKNAVERLARPPEEIRAENLRRWAATVTGVTAIAAIEPRRRCRAAGVIQN